MYSQWCHYIIPLIDIVWFTQASSRIRGRSLSSSWSDLSLFNNEVGTDGDPDSSSYTDSVLDVIHPDSPYGLIQVRRANVKPITIFQVNGHWQDVLPSSKTRPTNKFSRNRHPDSIFDLRGFNELDGLDPEEVWLSDGNLLVLKGGTTPNKSGFDNVWEPLDDYEAPYREPVLAPPGLFLKFKRSCVSFNLLFSDAKVTLTSDLGQYAVVVPPPKTSPPPSTHRVPRVQVHSKSGQGVVFQSDGWIPTTGQVQVHPAKPRFQRHSLIDTKVQSEPKHQQQQQVAWMPFLGTFVKASKVQDNLVESSNDVMDHVAVMPRGQKVYSYPQLPKQSSSLRHYARQSAIKRMSIQPPLHPYHHQRPPTTLQQNRFQFLRRFLRQWSLNGFE